MATTRLPDFCMENALKVPGVTMPEYKQAGSTLNVSSYSFDAAGTEGIQFHVPYLPAYGSGNLTFTVRWYGDSATTGDVVWGGAVAAITPNTDSQDAETKAFATETTATDSHLGTTAQRIHEVDITVSNLDSIATGDEVWFRVQRLGGNGSDTMSGDAQMTALVVSYSDT